MHILIIPSWYKSYPGDVLGSFFEEQARALQKAGNKVGVVFHIFHPFSDLFKRKIPQPGFYDDNGLPTYSVNIQGFVPKSRRFNDNYEAWATEQLFKKYVKQFGKPDIIHAHSVFHGGICGERLTRIYGIPLVNTEHLTHYMTGGLSADYDIPVARKVFRAAAANIVVGTVFRKELARAVSLQESDFRVVFNMVADLFFENRSKKNFTQGEPFRLFTNSFLNPRKNHKLIFDAMRIVIDKGYDVRLVVGGDGIAAEDLKQYVEQAGLKNVVEFKGMLSRKQVKENLDDSHAFVLASKYETFGVVLIESLACGRPVISTNSGGPMDIINIDNGILLNTMEVDEMASAMIQMMDHYNQYDQDAISKEAALKFSEQQIAGQLMNIYNEVLSVKQKQ